MRGRQTVGMEIRYLDDEAAALAVISRAFDAALAAAVDRGEVADVVLTGGRSGAAVAAHLADALLRHPEAQVRVWIADERWVPTTDTDRNDTPIVAALPASMRVLVQRHLTPPVDPGIVAADYAQRLRNALADKPFAAVVLSMGEDGHVASVFPGHATPSAVAYVEPASPKPPLVRTTIALPMLARTSTCLVLALGVSKAEAVHRADRHDATLPIVQLSNLVHVQLLTDVIPRKSHA